MKYLFLDSRTDLLCGAGNTDLSAAILWRLTVEMPKQEFYRVALAHISVIWWLFSYRVLLMRQLAGLSSSRIYVRLSQHVELAIYESLRVFWQIGCHVWPSRRIQNDNGDGLVQIRGDL